ncbi:putative short-chain oxidoreductase [Aspergillus clavatus NRRL 1]|uniref:Short-chain oxidoreductase, putative n=1 Tax=Aspergillus clavatus (strain ATCC 1007 / CBS 513.65 / DSM 816 / NCTC 3887 / NRRL 1 / QM 1276 / 107) TaxID=344612 RepID=A1CCC6_ASPCL|nr:short-chain oxidoreductase, putative [Aspergillus clavatus NRRL 1]EAW12183.1 short-chain oxidoreductase, putative [Aspergillus clavatus NRRL 1]
MSQIWLITGTSSGLGTEFVTQALARGDKVIATARDITKIAHLAAAGAATMQLDVTAPQAEMDAKAVEAIAVYGRVDVLVNNAGYMQFGTLEDLKYEDYLSQFNTNVFGIINITKAFLPHFRQRRQGVVVAIGSSVAWKAFPTVGAYCASKAALHSIMETLSQETASTGIKTLLVEPGQFRTNILDATKSMFVETSVPEYRDLVDASLTMFRSANGRETGDPRKGVARVIDVVKGENAARGKAWPNLLPLGGDAVDALRGKCLDTLRMLDEWKDVSTGTDFEV